MSTASAGGVNCRYRPGQGTFASQPRGSARDRNRTRTRWGDNWDGEGTPAHEIVADCELNRWSGPPLAGAASTVMAVNAKTAGGRRKRPTRASCRGGVHFRTILIVGYCDKYAAQMGAKGSETGPAPQHPGCCPGQSFREIRQVLCLRITERYAVIRHSLPTGSGRPRTELDALTELSAEVFGRLGRRIRRVRALPRLASRLFLSDRKEAFEPSAVAGFV